MYGDTGGAVGALVLRAMLSSIGLRKTMLVYSGIDAVLLIIAILIIKERKPEVPMLMVSPRSQEASESLVVPAAKGDDNAIVWFDRAFLVDPVFWSLGVSLFLCVMWVAHFLYGTGSVCLTDAFFSFGWMGGRGYLAPIFFLPTFVRDKIPGVSDIASTSPYSSVRPKKNSLTFLSSPFIHIFIFMPVTHTRIGNRNRIHR